MEPLIPFSEDTHIMKQKEENLGVSLKILAILLKTLLFSDIS